MSIGMEIAIYIIAFVIIQLLICVRFHLKRIHSMLWKKTYPHEPMG